MLGNDESNKLADEILSNTSSPCGSDSPTCFIRQTTIKTKEPFTQYPCLGKIYLIVTFYQSLVIITHKFCFKIFHF